MTALSLNIRDEALDKVLYLLESLPHKDVQIVNKVNIEEINPVKLPKDHFDYVSEEELSEMDRLVDEALQTGLENLKSFDELRNEL